jgi:hypothetical protein
VAMVLAYAASLAIFGMGNIAIQWPAMQWLPPGYFLGWVGVQIGVCCVFVFCTLVGGFPRKPRGLSDGTRT